ncbi:Striatin-3 [Grifola frondosa]|uniref:Striatin-3 n=1 Tax=Grifola frondosa TaxID=5627 RepID=A0A1C7MG10_GRIFR|nr:Striatin-3 [Grifola frondosa]
MLEYALRVERSKQLVQPASQSVPPAKLATLQSQMGSSSQKDDGSSGSSPRSEDSPLPPDRMSTGSVPNGAVSGGPPSRTQTWIGSASWSVANGPTAATVGTMSKPPPGRDPKSRTRSRDYLKQCLQEVKYLTSTQAMNPLPNRPLLNNPSLPLQLPNVPSFEQIPFNGRPRKVMPEVGKDFPLLNGMSMISGPSSAPATSGSQVNPIDRMNLSGPGMLPSQQPQQGSSGLSQQMQQQPQPQLGQLEQQPSQGKGKEREGEGESQPLTDIFRPDDWKEKLRLSHETSEQARIERANQGSVSSWERQSREEDEEGREEELEEEEEASVIGESDGAKVWKAKRTLRNHLDAVRALAFHPTELCLATGGDDNTVKIWRVDGGSLASTATRPTTEVEPQLTLRGHSAAITRLVHSPSKGLLYSASLDSSIRIWALPRHRTRRTRRMILRAHASTLISCGAEGTVKVAVAYQNAAIKVFDIETGKEVSRLQVDAQDEEGTSAQANSIVSHPTMPLLVTAHEDKHIRIFDIITGQCTHSMLAHLDAVTSLSIDAAGFALVSGSHDCSVRFWDILGSRACIQENTSHREKAREGVLDVEFHQSLSVMASAGADGVVKLYAST